MSRSWRLFADDVMTYVDAALRLTRGLTREQVFADERTRFAVLHALEVVGEAVKRIPPSVRGLRPEVPWGLIAGFRDRLAHRYWEIDEDVVWDVLTRDLDHLRDAVEELLTRDDVDDVPPAS